METFWFFRLRFSRAGSFGTVPVTVTADAMVWAGNSASRGPRLVSNALTPYEINKLHRLHSPFRVRMGLRTPIRTFSFATLEMLQTNDKNGVIRSIVKTLRKQYWELSHDVTKIYPTKLLILLRSFTLMMFKSSWNLCSHKFSLRMGSWFCYGLRLNLSAFRRVTRHLKDG